MSEKRALIVEDAKNWVRQHELSLRELGFETFIANSYAEAQGLLRHGEFDLAVIDLHLKTRAEPENLNGVYLLEYLVEKNIPVIVVTARGVRKLVDEIYRGFDVFEILDKLSFSPEKFKEYALQATSLNARVANDREKKTSLSRKKIEALIAELMQGTIAEPGKFTPPRREDNKALETKPLHVFISHSAKDKSLAGRLAHDLRALGLHVWYDSEEIHVGDTILEKIEQGFSDCDFLVLILSPDSAASWMVRQELMLFLNEEKRRGHALVLPVLYKDCQIPALLEGRHYADFRESYEAGLTELCRRLCLDQDRHDK